MSHPPRAGAAERSGRTPAFRLLLAVGFAAACGDGGDGTPPGMEGGPTRAEALLVSERPWRAARVMDRYLEQAAGEIEDEHRVLAARAAAGWGDWPAVDDLLSEVPALDTHANGLGLYLLGRARDAAGDPAGAAEAYRAFLALSPPAGELQAERGAARLRLGLALVRAGERDAAREPLDVSAETAGGAAEWLGLLEADALAAAGDTAAVRRSVEGFDEGMLGLRAWRARVEAAWQADDVALARALANRARAWAGTAGTQAEFLVAAARAGIEMGDLLAARAALRSAIDREPAGPHARAAADLLGRVGAGPDDQLAIARVNSAQGLHEAALEGYRSSLEAGRGTPADRIGVRLEYAEALFYAERYDEVEPALDPILESPSARFLLGRTQLRLGEYDAAVETYVGLAGRLAGTGEGVRALFLAADARHAEGDVEAARELYERVAERYPGTDRMGLAMMRLAGMAFLEREYLEAARIWDRYRQRYPSGSRAPQATYWSARARLEMGETAEAARLFSALRERERDSYYALLASRRLDEPFWPLPMSSSPPASHSASDRVNAWMQGIDLLRAAGFPDEASAQADRVVARAGNDQATLYALAEALVERGYSQRAIRLGLRLQGAGRPNRRLLRILFPFPYRTLITEEAREQALDPFVAAALIRQESMFEARITSYVGARGLMQIMPATGRELADAVGIEPWDAELLYHPEINVHLGTTYLAQHMESYDGSLPSVFSAYNAGPHRVEWWSEFPEYGREELFTERIPFRETRDYVKILTRNLAIYRGLYGGETVAAGDITGVG